MATKPIQWLLGALVAVGLLGVTGCGSDADDYQPTAYGPTVGGQAYCAYVVDPAECANSGVNPAYWHQMGTTQPAAYYPNNGTDLISQLFLWHLMYHAWYGSPGYYNNYVPVSYRATYVTKYVTVFDGRYGSQEHSVESNAKYKSAKTGQVVTGNKVKTNQFSGGNNPAKPAGNAPKVNDPAKPGGGAPKPAAPKPQAPAPRPPAPRR